MMNEIEGELRRRRPPERDVLELVGLAALSVAGALILIPAVALNGWAGARPFSGSGRDQIEELDDDVAI